MQNIAGKHEKGREEMTKEVAKNMNCVKHIPLQGAKNTRDLGGYPTINCRITRWGMLYRSDSLNELTESDWNVLRKRNI